MKRVRKSLGDVRVLLALTSKEGEWAGRHSEMSKEALASAEHNPEISNTGRQSF